MSESEIDWPRLGGFIVSLLLVGTLVFLGYRHIVGSDLTPSSADSGNLDSRSLAQIQRQLTDMEKRLAVLETRRKSDSPGPSRVVEKSETAVPSQDNAGRLARSGYQISPATAAQTRPIADQPPPHDSASAQTLAKLQQGIGALQDEASSNREAWQATANRLADVAGELGTQHGQIIQNQDELNRFLARTEHTPLTFELSRSSAPTTVGPVRLSLQASNQKTQRYTLCVYLQGPCVQVRDRVPYEVVQLAVSPDSAPLELIATKIGKDNIVGYLEVASEHERH